MSRHRVNRWLFIFGVWTMVGLFFTSQAYFVYDNLKTPLVWYQALIPNFGFCFIWALSTPIVLRLAQRFPIDRQHWIRSLGLHVLAAGILSMLQSPYYFVVRALVFPDLPVSYTRPLELVYINLDRQLLIYFVILLFNHAFEYYQRYQERLTKASQLETQLAQAQLESLKMQLQPHFLFNTLHSISSLIHEDIDKADTMIARLGDFLRLTLDHTGSQKIPLHQEVESITSYIDIERIRFGDRLSVAMEIDEATLDALIPSFLWQPVVENAIRHGIATLPSAGRITIRSKSVNGFLQLQVQDNGPGLPSHDTPPSGREGLGLANTRACLQQLYGDASFLHLTNAPQGGVLATLQIPLEKENTP